MEGRISVSGAADALGISRVQFQRYLKGESFPKPGMLKRICDMLGVDARIYTEPVTKTLLASMHRGPSEEIALVHKAAIYNAIGWAIPGDHSFLGPHSLDNGLYRLWRKSFTFHDRVNCVHFQISESEGVKFLRGFEPRAIFSERVTGPSREYRGFGHRVASGYHFVVFRSDAMPFASTMYFHHFQCRAVETHGAALPLWRSRKTPTACARQRWLSRRSGRTGPRSGGQRECRNT